MEVAAVYRHCFGDRCSAIWVVVIDRAVGEVVALGAAVVALVEVVSAEALVVAVISAGEVRAEVGEKIVDCRFLIVDWTLRYC